MRGHCQKIVTTRRLADRLFICSFSLVCSVCLVCFVCLQGCMVGPDFCPEPAPDVQGYTERPLPRRTVRAETKGGNAQTYLWGRDVEADWWRLFRSKELNALIAKGLAHNPTVHSAQAALVVARENYIAGVGALFPAISLQGIAQKQRFSSAQFGTSQIQTTKFDLFNVSVNISYALDIFGGIRRNIESLCALVDYQRFILEGTYLTLTANIATAAITEASLRAQIEATRELIQLQEELLKIVKSQFELGGVSGADILAQETQNAQTKATLPPLEKNLAQTRHQLAALVGEFPSESCIPKFNLDSLILPGEIPVSLPSTLVQQRPDIRGAEALVHQANALIGVAIANMLPQVTLFGNYGYEANKLSSLFSPSNVIWNYGAQIIQPVFQGGTLNAKRRAAIATFEEAAANYRQTVLQAFQNVADSLKALETDARLLKDQTNAENAAKKTLDMTTGQFKLGSINYLSLLNAQRDYHQSRIIRIRAQALRFTDTVALFQALGGNWGCHD